MKKGPSVGSIDFQVKNGAAAIEIFSRPARRGAVLASAELSAGADAAGCGLELPPVGCVYRPAGQEENAGLCGMVLECPGQEGQPAVEDLLPLAAVVPTE